MNEFVQHPTHWSLITGRQSGKALWARMQLIEIWRHDSDAVITVYDPKGEEETRTVSVRELI